MVKKVRLLFKDTDSFNCIFLSCYAHVLEWIHAL